jgi:hypothetical protein
MANIRGLLRLEAGEVQQQLGAKTIILRLHLDSMIRVKMLES